MHDEVSDAYLTACDDRLSHPLTFNWEHADGEPLTCILCLTVSR